jgi:hypothetical protein
MKTCRRRQRPLPLPEAPRRLRLAYTLQIDLTGWIRDFRRAFEAKHGKRPRKLR